MVSGWKEGIGKRKCGLNIEKQLYVIARIIKKFRNTTDFEQSNEQKERKRRRRRDRIVKNGKERREEGPLTYPRVAGKSCNPQMASWGLRRAYIHLHCELIGLRIRRIYGTHFSPCPSARNQETQEIISTGKQKVSVPAHAMSRRCDREFLLPLHFCLIWVFRVSPQS